MRREPQLTQFEVAQIANLCPADAEEAKSVIPRCVLLLPLMRVLADRFYMAQSGQNRRRSTPIPSGRNSDYAEIPELILDQFLSFHFR